MRASADRNLFVCRDLCLYQ